MLLDADNGAGDQSNFVFETSQFAATARSYGGLQSEVTAKKSGQIWPDAAVADARASRNLKTGQMS